MNILGISCFYHDSAACLVRDGQIIAAAQEERFSRIKHDHDFPKKSIAYCLKQGNISTADLEYVVFYEKPMIKFERILETSLAFAPKGLGPFLMALPLWLKQKLWIPDLIHKELEFEGEIIFTEHHESHAASAFFPSPFKQAAFLTMDGVGEWTTTSYGIGKDNEVEILSELHFPHSLGLLYSAFTYYLGFKVNSAEYKVMGLAPYGEPIYVQKILDYLIDIKEDGSFRLNMKYFNYCTGLTMTNRSFHQLFGGLPRQPETHITQREMDLARSIQVVTEIVMLRCANFIFHETKEKYLCLAGGVALNCVGNGRILRESPFKGIWIQPAAGDAGGALGAALFVWYQLLGNARSSTSEGDHQQASLIGPEYQDTEIETFLIQNNIPHRQLDEKKLLETTANLLSQEKVIGWFQGRMEFGPRALGNRSILGDARSPRMQARMNLKIKYRESFRPFAPAVLEENVSDYFELDESSPYMLLVAYLRKDRRHKMSKEELQLWGIEKLKANRSEVPAVTHIDYSARVQTVNEKDNSIFYRLIKTFKKKTGCPVIINTSFNVRGEPIVCTPQDAYLCFMHTEMDYLIIGHFLLDKQLQPPLKEEDEWRKRYELD